MRAGNGSNGGSCCSVAMVMGDPVDIGVTDGVTCFLSTSRVLQLAAVVCSVYHSDFHRLSKRLDHPSYIPGIRAA